MSATFTPYRNDLDGEVIKQLQSRKTAYNIGKFNNHYQTATRNPAYCSVTSDGVTVPEYPQTLFGGGMYETQFKPGPLLKQCVVRSGGDFGLILEVEAEIQCNTLTDFERVEKAFLRLGKIVDVKFGYVLPRGSGYKGKSIKGCRVARFSFSTTPEGFWMCKFTALAPGQQILDLEVNNRIEAKSRKYFLGKDKFDVAGIADLMLFHAQGNGQRALDQLKDGEVIIPPIGGAIVAFKSDFLYSNLITFGKGPTKPESESGVIHYYTLQYIVELFNKEIVPVVATQADKANFNAVMKLKIKFDNTLSRCYTSPEIRSAFPTKILLLGVPVLNGLSGNYKSNIGAGKDFEIGMMPAGVGSGGGTSCYTGNADGRAELWPGRILFEHKVVMEALNASETIISPAENTSPKQAEEGTVKVKQFFNYLFTQLADATGGMIKLRLALHPKIHGTDSPSDDLMHEMYIFDENNGKIETIKCWTFNPLAGDGTTRSCTISSEVGSAQYQGWAVTNTKKATDPIAEVNEDCVDGTTKGRNDEADAAKLEIAKLIYIDGALGKSFFNEVHMQAIRQQLGALRMGAPAPKKLDMAVYPGLGIDVSLDGIFGFMPGNAIFSTQLSKDYKAAKTYFMVEQVENIFDGNTSDWSTNLKGKLSFHTNVVYKE